MNCKQLATLLSKDILLLKRDNVLWYVILVFVLSFVSVVRFDDSSSDTNKPKKIKAEFLQMMSQSKPPAQPAITGDLTWPVSVAVIGDPKFQLHDGRFNFVAMSKQHALESLINKKVDAIIDYTKTTRLPLADKAVPVVLIVKQPRDKRSLDVSLLLEKAYTDLLVDQLGADAWLKFSFDRDHVPADFSVSDRSRINVAALLSLLSATSVIVLLSLIAVVEENTKHTLPMLMCHADASTIFLAKFLFCLIPTFGAAFFIGTLATIGSAHPAPFQAILAACLFAVVAANMVILTAALVTLALRSRNNLEMVPRGAMIVLLVLVLAVIGISRLTPDSPGLHLLPVISIFACLEATRESMIDLRAFLAPMTGTAALACFAYLIGKDYLRCEEGLSGEVRAPDPRNGELTLVVLACIGMIIAFLGFGFPFSLIHPGYGNVASSLIFIIVAAFILRPRISHLKGCYFRADNRWLIPTSLLAVLAGGLGAYIAPYCNGTATAAYQAEVDRFYVLFLQSAPLELILAMTVLRVFGEELALRGAIVGGLANRLSSPALIAVMAGLGSVLHPLESTWLFMGLFSAALTWLRLQTGSIIPAVLMHLSLVVASLYALHRVPM
jgi:membrane protease YdiL (CAAX protease family)